MTPAILTVVTMFVVIAYMAGWFAVFIIGIFVSSILGFWALANAGRD